MVSQGEDTHLLQALCAAQLCAWRTLRQKALNAHAVACLHAPQVPGRNQS